jgi:hypothetical protein
VIESAVTEEAVQEVHAGWDNGRVVLRIASNLA